MKKIKLEFRILWIWFGFLIENFMAKNHLLLSANPYSSTNLQSVRAFIKDEANAFELRHQMYGAMDAFMFRRDFTIPNLDQIRKSALQTTSAIYMKNKTFPIGTSLSCNPSGTSSGSGMVDLTWITYTANVEVQHKRFYNNEVARLKATANDFYNAEISILDDVETYLMAYCEANRTGVNALNTVNSRNTWVGGGVDIVQVANANMNRFYNLARADMKTNKYKGQIMEIHDSQWTAEQAYYQAQGAANSANTEFQFKGFDSYTSDAILPSGYYGHLHYLIPVHGVAILDWTSQLNRDGRKEGDSEWGTYQSLVYPGLDMQLFKKTACSDTTADGGSKQDLVETHELSLTFAVTKAPLSTANETPIFKYGLLNS